MNKVVRVEEGEWVVVLVQKGSSEASTRSLPLSLTFTSSLSLPPIYLNSHSPPTQDARTRLVRGTRSSRL